MILTGHHNQGQGMKEAHKGFIPSEPTASQGPIHRKNPRPQPKEKYDHVTSPALSGYRMSPAC